MSDGRLALFALIAIAIWTFIALPLIYLPSGVPIELLGIKPGEWLLAFATFGLWYATWRLVTGADQTAQRQLRAYVSLVGGGIAHANVDNQQGYLVQIELKNSGITPGYDFTTWIVPPEVRDLNELPFGPPSPESERTGKSIIAPNTSAWINVYYVWKPGELEAVRKREKGVFVWGGANYKDAFGFPRTFLFRLLIFGFENSGNGWALTPHRLGYEAD
jgi:hypothetical protein